MAKPNGFQFKQFFIAHDQCAMKVNTDGIILGSLADIQNKQQILDIGTGTGLVAIMLAQRSTSDTQIIALEIEPSAYQQALENAEQSPWNNKLTVLNCDLMQFKPLQKFDLIVSNPPYFDDSLASRSSERDLARATIQSHFDWLQQASTWLTEEGKITFILPFDSGEKLIEQAKSIEFHCIERWDIATKTNKPPKRLAVTFCKKFAKTDRLLLTIYDEDNQYTDQYKFLTQDFYLNF